MITIREMENREWERVSEMDVSETDNFRYRVIGDALEQIPQTWSRAAWDAETWRSNLADWNAHLGIDLMVGAFDGEQLVGMASLCYVKVAGTAQLVSMHVSQSHRRQGIGELLMQQIVNAAQQDGADQLYVWATNSPSAVGFYLSQGFQPLKPDDALYNTEEDDDIQMIMKLA